MVGFLGNQLLKMSVQEVEDGEVMPMLLNLLEIVDAPGACLVAPIDVDISDQPLKSKVRLDDTNYAASGVLWNEGSIRLDMFPP